MKLFLAALLVVACSLGSAVESWQWMDMGAKQTIWDDFGTLFDVADMRGSPHQKFVGWLQRARDLAVETKVDIESRLPSAPQHIQDLVASDDKVRASGSSQQYSAPPFVMPGKKFAWIPLFTEAAKIGQTVSWSAPCFGQTTVTTSMSGNTLSMQWDLTQRAAGLCMDTYMIADLQSFKFEFFDFLHEGHLSIDFDLSKYTATQMSDLKMNGVRLFRFLSGNPLTLVSDLIDTADLFLPALTNRAVPAKTQLDNLEFLKTYVNIDMEARSTVNVTLPEGYLQSGDFLAIIRLDGLDPMLAWGMGDHTGHFTIAMEIDGVMNVCESQAQSTYWPIRNGIQCNPYDHWVQMAYEASFNVVVVPLSPEKRAQFNYTAALEFVNESVGLNYGYANLLFGWVDTEFGNYPYPLSPQFYELLINVVNAIDSTIADLVWTRPLNKRLGTAGVPIPDVWQQMMDKNLTFVDLVTMPEQDAWIYDDMRLSDGGPGKSMVCDVFVCSVYKAAGLFGDLADVIQCTEMTNYDVYELDFYTLDASALPEVCRTADPTLPYCQILGDYRMTLPGANSRKPYPGYANKCTRGTPPLWNKPEGC